MAIGTGMNAMHAHQPVIPHEAYDSKFELRVVMLCSMAGMLMQALDTTIANVALPYMQGSLRRRATRSPGF